MFLLMRHKVWWKGFVVKVDLAYKTTKNNNGETLFKKVFIAKRANAPLLVTSANGG